MALVFIPSLLQDLTGGNARVTVPGTTVAQVIEHLEQAWPGMADRLVDGTRLRPNLSVAVDGEITPLGLLEPVGPHSEVHFVAAIKGGEGAGAFEELAQNGAAVRGGDRRVSGPFGGRGRRPLRF